jgi:lysophospholipase L1-like esterase
MPFDARSAAASIYRPHHYLLYELAPSYVSPDGLTHHNRHGFRGPEIPVPKPPGTFRVVCMGESSTYCVGIPRDEDTYPARLEHHLRAAAAPRALDVVNAGVGGYTSAENLLCFIFKVHPLEPDLIVYYYTHNDVHPRRLPQLSRDYREYSKSWDESPRGAAWVPRLRAFLDLALGRRGGDVGAHVRRLDEYEGRTPAANVFRNPPDHFRANMRSLAVLARSWGIQMLFVNPPYRELDRPEISRESVNPVTWAVHEHRLVIDEIGRELGLSVYDLRQGIPCPPSSPAGPGEHFRDRVHFNEKGADLVGKLVAGAILRAGLLSTRGQREHEAC